MVAVEADLLDEGTPDLILARLNEDFGGKVNVFIDNAAGGYGQTIDQARAMNVIASQRLLDKLRGNFTPDAVSVFNTSVPAHLYQTLQEKERRLLGDYDSVAQSKNEREINLRSVFAAGSQRLAVVVGNGLEGSLVTRLLRRGNKAFVGQMLDISEEGYFPTMMDMANAVVRECCGTSQGASGVGRWPLGSMHLNQPSTAACQPDGRRYVAGAPGPIAWRCGALPGLPDIPRETACTYNDPRTPSTPQGQKVKSPRTGRFRPAACDTRSGSRQARPAQPGPGTTRNCRRRTC